MTQPTDPTQPAWGTPPPPRRPDRYAGRKWYARPWAIITGLVLGLGVVLVVIVATFAGDERKTAATATTSYQQYLDSLKGTDRDPNATSPATEPAEPPASEPTEETSAPAIVGGVGDAAEITVNGADAGRIRLLRLTTARSDFNGTPADRSDDDLAEKPKRGRFVIARVEVVGIGEPFDINPLDFYVREPDGTHVEEQCCAQFGPELDAVTLAKGEKTAGTMVFDVKVTHGALVYAPNLGETPVAEWRF
jgi:hypothetical protein